ncbi:hypothetical protein [Dickeya phage Amaethon]|nr:hypothetical protein [Dickeya phage Amaethon]
MGFFSKITDTVKNAITSPISTTTSLLKGDVSGALSSAISPVTSIIGAVVGSSGSSGGSSGDSATDFARSQYEDWQKVFGPVQNNLSDYYSNLTPEYYVRQGLQAFNQERETQLNDLNTLIRQEDLSADVSTELRKNAALDAAQSRATIRRNAPAAVAASQQAFLNLGMQNSAAANYQSQLNSSSNYALQQAAQSAQAKAQTASAVTKGVGSLIQTGLTSYFGAS